MGGNSFQQYSVVSWAWSPTKKIGTLDVKTRYAERTRSTPFIEPGALEVEELEPGDALCDAVSRRQSYPDPPDHLGNLSRRALMTRMKARGEIVPWALPMAPSSWPCFTRRSRANYFREKRVS